MTSADISKGGAARGRRRWRARAALGCVLVTAAVAVVTSTPDIAEAAAAPRAELSFSPARISAGAKPGMTFISQDVPTGSLLYLQESADGGRQWKNVDKTAATQGTANLAILSEGIYEFRIVITDNGSALATSAPATLTVTGAGGATPSPAPSRSGIPWLDIIVKPIWDAIIATIVAWAFSML